MNLFNKKTRLQAAALLLSATLLSGCSILPFESPEKQRAAEQTAAVKSLAAEEVVNVRDLLATDLTLKKTLTNSVGTVLAIYSVTLPQFSVSEAKPQSFSRINEFYRNELNGLSEDCDSFFALAKSSYGENWDTAPQATKAFSTTITYELLDAPTGYACVKRMFDVKEAGQEDLYFRGDVFLLDNGWDLSLEMLFGSDYTAASSLLISDLLSWCEKNSVTVTMPEKLTAGDFAEGYALTKSAIIFYSQPFQLNNTDAKRYAITVPIAHYGQMLEELNNN